MSCNRMCFTNDGMQMDLECASCPGRDGYVPTEVKKMKNGDELRDNDPRMYSGNRVLEIIGIDKTHVIARQGNLHPVRIRIDRIYPEGKQRRTGFTLIRKIRESKEGFSFTMSMGARPRRIVARLHAWLLMGLIMFRRLKNQESKGSW